MVSEKLRAGGSEDGREPDHIADASSQSLPSPRTDRSLTMVTHGLPISYYGYSRFSPFLD